MITGRKEICSLNPFQGGQLPRRPACIRHDTRYGDMVWALLTQCWALDPQGRPTAGSVAVKVSTLFNNGIYYTLLTAFQLDKIDNADLYGLTASGVPFVPAYIHTQMARRKLIHSTVLISRFCSRSYLRSSRSSLIMVVQTLRTKFYTRVFRNSPLQKVF